MKEEIRVIGLDDSYFRKNSGGQVLVVGTVYRGGKFLDGLISFHVKNDGTRATQKIVENVKKTKFYPQVRALMINGVAFAGLNVIDIKKISEETGVPVIIVSRRQPDIDSLKQALKKFDDWEERWRKVLNAGPVHRINFSPGDLYYQFAGTNEEVAERLIKICSPNSNVPEPVRAAHMISTGLVLGESRGGA